MKTTFYDRSIFFKKNFEQSTSVHYQAISHTDNSNLKLQFFFRSINLHKISNISKRLITENNRTQQTMRQELIQTDEEGWNVCFDSLMVYLSL